MLKILRFLLTTKNRIKQKIGFRFKKIILIVLVASFSTLTQADSLNRADSFNQANALLVQPGDLIFQTSTSSQSEAIQRATNSHYSHMGIIFYQKGKSFVYEASATVRFTPLKTWINQGIQGHYVVKRLKNADRLLTPSALKEMEKIGQTFANRPYDLTFKWNDERFYCSELVWKIYDRALDIQIGNLQQIKDFNLDDPIVQAKMKERYGDQIPYNEPVISPQAMFESPLLEIVMQK